MVKGYQSIQWGTGLLTKEFGLNRILEGYPLLEDWVNVGSLTLPQAEIQLLEKKTEKTAQKG